MPPVPCVHLNVHVDNVKKVLCGSGIGVEVSGTNVKITRKWGHCDDIVVFTKGKVVCKSTIDEPLHQIKESNMGTMYGIVICCRSLHTRIPHARMQYSTLDTPFLCTVVHTSSNWRSLE